MTFNKLIINLYLRMKRIIFILCGLALLISCTQSQKQGTKLSPDEQKVKLETTAEILMEKCPASDFQDFSDFGSFLNEQYFSYDDYDYSAFENRYEELADIFFKETNNGAVLTLVLAQCTGEFVFGPRKIIYSESDKLSLSVKDEDGRTYLVELQTSGEVQTLKNTDIEDFFITLKVPQNIAVVITRDGERMASVELSYDLRLTTNINPSSDMAKIWEKVTVKDYVFETTCSYDAQSHNASIDWSFAKGGETLASHNAKANVSLSGKTLDQTDIKNITDYSSYLDIMGAIQVQGYGSDYNVVYRAIDDYDYKSAKSASEAADILNEQLSLKLYYDGTTTEQAHVEFECQKYESSYYVSYDPMPVIVFNDGSRYNIEDYFSEDAFKYLIRQFEIYIDMFVELVEDWE